MAGRRQIDPRLAAEAAQWVERLTRDATQRCQSELGEWLLRSPNHIDEFLVAKLTFSLFQRIDPARQIDVDELVQKASRQVVLLREASAKSEEASFIAASEAPGSRYRGSRVIIGRRAVLAAALVGVITAGLLWLDRFNASTYSTGLGEQRSLRLSDGSFIELNTRSKVRIQFETDARTVHLIQGEALFRVAHDAHRPFRVSTSVATIQAVGTQFDVYVASDSDTRVAVVEGRVRVGGAGSSPGIDSAVASEGDSITNNAPMSGRLVTLAAGEEASVSPKGRVVKDLRPDISEAVAWRNGRLIFHDVPIAEVIKEFSRYSDFRFTVLGDTLARRRISGVFHADDPQTLIALFEGDKSVEVVRVDNGVMLKLP